MIEVELRQYLMDFKDRFKECLLKHELYGVHDFDDLLSSLVTIVSGVEQNKELFIPIDEHKIDKYGQSEAVVRFSNAGMSHRQIADTISIMIGSALSEQEVREWLANYSQLGYTRKQRPQSNLFDVQERMQDIFSELSDHLEEVKSSSKEEFYKAKTTKQQVVLEYYKEIRNLTKDAKAILESINHQQKLNEFKKIVVETIRQVDAGTATRIIQKLEQDKALFSALLPPD